MSVRSGLDEDAGGQGEERWMMDSEELAERGGAPREDIDERTLVRSQVKYEAHEVKLRKIALN